MRCDGATGHLVDGYETLITESPVRDASSGALS
jgi:hypothetical protein